jgi:minor extracellular serine protease Vpr
VRKVWRAVICVCVTMFFAEFAAGDTGVNKATQADKAFAKYGLTGKGVIVAVLDRGIDYTHPDFRNADGTTRIKMMWDMSAQNLCSTGNPAPVVYTQTQINTAITSGVPLAERDAVGHGTVTAGIAAGNGRAVLPSSLQYAGLAPGADLLIVKVTSEGAPAHGTQPAENPFQGCFSQALDLVVQEAAKLGEPIVALINSGTQWGPIDGTSAVSQKIDADFGLNNPGHAYVEASGDEGTLANHARGTYSQTATVFPLTKSTTATDYFSAWYTGSVPANVTLTMNDTGATATVTPGSNCASSVDGSITLCTYLPGQQFYPWMSSGPDRAVWIHIIGHSGAGSLTFQATQNATGTADVYGDAGANVTYTNSGQLTPGRLSDYSSTFSAIVTACFNVRTSWTDINNKPESLTSQGVTNGLWRFSSGGPTRDGRVPPNGGVDVTTPGGNLFAAYGLNTYWETFSFNLIKGGKGFYGRQSATSGASPILEGAVALLLQMNPKLTISQIRQYLHQSAVSDSFTGTTPNEDWGSGKINVLGSATLVAAGFNTNPAVSPTSLTFPPTPVHTTSATQSITFSNTGTATDALGITSVATNGDFKITNTMCGSSLAAGANCTVTIDFKPTKTGTRNGTLTIKDFNTHSPHTVALTGTGT